MKKRLLVLFALAGVVSGLVGEAPRVFPAGTQPDDVRLGPLKDLNGFFPFAVPETLDAWERRAGELRRRVLVANGLWPMPERTPLNAVIHGRVDRPGFTVEKVYFESVPGFFVTGLLFRPENPGPGRRPAVLSPHGHGGRLQDHGPEGIRNILVTGGERFEESGRMPKIARCATLARLGCVVFLYDMIGYADNMQLSYELAHRFAEQRPEFEGLDRWGFYSAQAEMRMQSIFGLQTWNSIRALDFLESLPDVDPERIAVTGGSGGGTQTIMLCAIDSRPVAAFPNGMVSSSMQGGCTCENASLLRIDTGNLELAGLFAPKPQGMTAADDWTKEMLVPGKGFPELQKLYGLYGKKDHVICPDLLHFPHNYNYVTRAIMYSWFNRHLGLGHRDPIVEEDFALLTPEEQAVWNEDHPRPAGGDEFERSLTGWLADRDRRLLDSLEDGARREVILEAWKTMIGRGLPEAEDTEFEGGKLRLVSAGEELPVVRIEPGTEARSVVIWVDGAGKDALFDGNGLLIARAREWVDAGCLLITADLFGQGEFRVDDTALLETRTVANTREFAGYTHGYNHSLFARQTHDILTLVAHARAAAPGLRIRLVGTSGAALQAAAAHVIADGVVARTLVEAGDFRFADIDDYRHPRFIPGAVKYGDAPGLLSLSGSIVEVESTEDPTMEALLAE